MYGRPSAYLLFIALVCGCASHPQTLPTQAPTTVSAEIKATALPPANNTFKHKVAVAGFVLPTTPQPADASRQAKALLDAHLQSTQKFVVLEHAALLEPMETSHLLAFNDETLGADFLISGTITSHETTRPGWLDGWRNERTITASSSVRLQLTDAYSKRVIFQLENSAISRWALNNDSKDLHEQTARLEAQALAAAIEKSLPTLTAALLHQPWRSQILSAQQGYILINGGAGQGIQIGDTFRVVANAPALVTSTPLATLRVISQAGEHENELSVCELVNGQLPPADFSQLSVLSER